MLYKLCTILVKINIIFVIRTLKLIKIRDPLKTCFVITYELSKRFDFDLLKVVSII